MPDLSDIYGWKINVLFYRVEEWANLMLLHVIILQNKIDSGIWKVTGAFICTKYAILFTAKIEISLHFIFSGPKNIDLVLETCWNLFIISKQFLIMIFSSAFNVNFYFFSRHMVLPATAHFSFIIQTQKTW